MSIETKHICDKCGCVVPKEKLRSLLVFIGQAPGVRYIGSTYDRNVTNGADWCVDCLLKSGIVDPWGPKEQAASVAVPTLEDIVREIVRSEMEPLR